MINKILTIQDLEQAIKSGMNGKEISKIIQSSLLDDKNFTREQLKKRNELFKELRIYPMRWMRYAG